MLTANSIKATVVLDPAEVRLLAAPPEGSKSYVVEVAIKGALLAASVSPRSVRKVLAAAKAHPEDVAVILQGKVRFANGAFVLEEAGIVAQPRKPREAVPEAVAA